MVMLVVMINNSKGIDWLMCLKCSVINSIQYIETKTEKASDEPTTVAKKAVS